MDAARAVAILLIGAGLASLAGYAWLAQQPWAAGAACDPSSSASQQLCRGQRATDTGGLTVVVLLMAVSLTLIGAAVLVAESLRS